MRQLNIYASLPWSVCADVPCVKSSSFWVTGLTLSVGFCPLTIGFSMHIAAASVFFRAFALYCREPYRTSASNGRCVVCITYQPVRQNDLGLWSQLGHRAKSAHKVEGYIRKYTDWNWHWQSPHFECIGHPNASKGVNRNNWGTLGREVGRSCLTYWRRKIVVWVGGLYCFSTVERSELLMISIPSTLIC